MGMTQQVQKFHVKPIKKYLSSYTPFKKRTHDKQSQLNGEVDTYWLADIS